MIYPHGFCPNCGTSVYARAEGGEHEGIVAVNVSSVGRAEQVCRWLIGEQGRTLKGVDISKFKIKELNGKSINVG